MLNKAMIIGRLGADLVLKQTASSSVVNMNVATDESYVTDKGDKVEKVEWHRVVVYGKMAENCHRYLKKGSLVYVEGKLFTNKWQDRDGNDRYTTEIKADAVRFLDRKE